MRRLLFKVIVAENFLKLIREQYTIARIPTNHKEENYKKSALDIVY